MAAALSYPAGRDAKLPDWLLQGTPPAEAARFDSVVIRGAGVGAMVCAGRLARSRAFEGRVRIAMPRPVEGPQLVNGCTLRARSLDYASQAFAAPYEDLVKDLYGEDSTQAQCLSQNFSLIDKNGAGQYRARRTTSFMQRPPENPIAYGLRNGHLVARLADRLAAMGVAFDDEVAQSFDDCKDRGLGDHTLVINGGHLPLEGVPAPAAPDRFVVASQVALRRRADSIVPPQGSFICLRRRDGAMDTGVIYPFQDPLTPGANYYVVFFRVVDPRAPQFAKSDEIAAITELRDGFCDAIGLDVESPETTEAKAMVPCLPWDDVGTHREDYFDLFRTYSACTPIITGDGMTRACLGGWLAAEAIIAGKDPVVSTNRGLVGWRNSNRQVTGALTTRSGMMVPLLRTIPKLSLGIAGRVPDVWCRLT